jgi:hypothetical protein
MNDNEKSKQFRAKWMTWNGGYHVIHSTMTLNSCSSSRRLSSDLVEYEFSYETKAKKIIIAKLVSHKK